MNDNKFVDLLPLGLTRGATLRDAYILILRELSGMRCMALLITPDEYKMVSNAMQGNRSRMSKLLRDTCDTFGIRMLCVVLHNNTNNGAYRSEIILQQGSDIRTIRQNVGTGVVLAMDLKLPLQVSAQYFEAMKNQAPKQDGSVEVRIPIAAMDESLLREALQEAVKEDNFEMASTLRDELQRREGLSHISSTTEL